MGTGKKRKRKLNRNVPESGYTYRDRLFRFVFREKKDLLALYNALNHSAYSNPEELIINTLEDVIYLGMKNDVSFLLNGTMNLYEHQATKNPNMPFRGLLYFSRIYESYAEQNGLNLYGRALLRLPFPRYVIFYNGAAAAEPDRKEMRLSAAFVGGQAGEVPAIECRAVQININHGHNQELLGHCRKLEEYAVFVGKVQENLNRGMELRTAVVQAVDACIGANILRDVLMKNKSEVVDMLLTSFDQELHDKQEREEAFREGERAGKAEGEAIGRTEGRTEGEAIGKAKGRAEGRTEGEAIGKAKGRTEGETKLSQLIQKLLADERMEDIGKVSSDKEYREKMYQEYHL